MSDHEVFSIPTGYHRGRLGPESFLGFGRLETLSPDFPTWGEREVLLPLAIPSFLATPRLEIGLSRPA